MKNVMKTKRPVHFRILCLLALGIFFRLPAAEIHWNDIGPHGISGRISDIESYPDHPRIILVGSASAGVYRSRDRGENWEYIFRTDGFNAIGDIAVTPRDLNLIWVGTGEPNASRSSFYGEGVFCSRDGGETWECRGLQQTHYISRIIIHPSRPDTVYVAAPGPLYSESPHRGLYQTTDGGRTWEKILFIDHRTGIIDLVMHPENPKILYAAAWERLKRPWKFEAYGPGSGIYRTLDGGLSWQRIFAGDEFTGRIGLTIGTSDPRVLMALVDNHREQLPPGEDDQELTIDRLNNLSIEDFLKLKNKSLQRLLDRMQAAEIYTPSVLKAFVRHHRITPRQVALMLFDINDRQFNPFITGPELYRSEDRGDTWRKINQESLNPYFYTFGFFFGRVVLSPADTDTVYVLGIEMLRSGDGGRTFDCLTRKQGPQNQRLVHVDSHALWIHPRSPRLLYLGTDGGLNISSDGGENWRQFLNLPITQCYRVSLGRGENPAVYSGLQDNGVVMGYRPRESGARYYWLKLLDRDGGDTCEIPGVEGQVYSAYQFGEIFRIDLKKGLRTGIKPQASPLTTPYRFHWLTPFFVSSHDPLKLYLGANMVLLSTDRGNHWTPVSPDLSRGREVFNRLPYGTISALAESPRVPGLLFAGTDDGNVWYFHPQAGAWRQIGQVLPGREVTSLAPSRFDPGKLYVTMSGLFSDDLQTYIFMTENLGTDWLSIRGQIQDEPVLVLREHPASGGVLLCGTVKDLYLTENDGLSWRSVRGNIPSVPFHDLAIDEGSWEVVVGTHGRGIYRLQDPRRLLQAPSDLP